MFYIFAIDFIHFFPLLSEFEHDVIGWEFVHLKMLMVFSALNIVISGKLVVFNILLFFPHLENNDTK